MIERSYTIANPQIICECMGYCWSKELLKQIYQDTKLLLRNPQFGEIRVSDFPQDLCAENVYKWNQHINNVIQAMIEDLIKDQTR